MMRTALPRSLVQPLFRSTFIAARPIHGTARKQISVALRPGSTQNKNAKTLALSTQLKTTQLTRYYATASITPGVVRSLEQEAEFGKKLLKPHPERITSSSSFQPVMDPDSKETETDMMAGIKHDLKVVRDTFKLEEVPTEAYRLGLAGVLPYLATSTATCLAAFELNHAAHHQGVGWVVSEETAQLYLNVLEPLQVGYGAVILSFLGAIHWGLEWAGYGGKGGYRRYAIGVLAPAIAWPTILLPVEYALITQFLAFNILYAVDNAATIRGWTPPWYGTYRFLLTFVVGLSIVVSLIGRGQVSDRIGTAPSAADRVKELQKHRDNGKAKGQIMSLSHPDDEDDEE